MNLPEPQLQMTRDASGRAIAHPVDDTPVEKLLAGFLRSDVQDAAYARELLGICRLQARTRGGRRRSATGNAYSVSIGRDVVIIDPLFPAADHSARAVPLSCFRKILARWQAALG